MKQETDSVRILRADKDNEKIIKESREGLVSHSHLEIVIYLHAIWNCS